MPVLKGHPSKERYLVFQSLPLSLSNKRNANIEYYCCLIFFIATGIAN